MNSISFRDSPKVRIFLAGIIQGSSQDDSMYEQDYRNRIKCIISKHLPNASIYCPVEHHPNSIVYDDRKAREVFLGHLEKVRQSHILCVYIPQASMGSAIEMWEAYQTNRVVIAVTPLKTNWVVRLLSDFICDDFTSFEELMATNQIICLLKKRFPAQS